MHLVFSPSWAARATLLAGLVAALSFAPLAFAQVVIPPIAPPKPAVPRAANAIVISTGDLNAALNWANQGAFADALYLNLRDLLCLLLREFSRQHVDLLDGGWLGKKLRSLLRQGGGYAA